MSETDCLTQLAALDWNHRDVLRRARAIVEAHLAGSGTNSWPATTVSDWF